MQIRKQSYVFSNFMSIRAQPFDGKSDSAWKTNVSRRTDTGNCLDIACVSVRVVDRAFDVDDRINRLIGCTFSRTIRICTFRLTSYLGEVAFLAFFLSGGLSRSGRSALQSNRGNSRRSDR